MHSDRMRQDTADACETAYRKYGALLYRLCYSFLLSGADAEDAVQDVFYKFMVKAPNFRDDDHERAWFLHVASNLCRDMLRRRGVRRAENWDDLQNTTAEPIAEERENRTLRLIFSLPDKYRQVFVLHYLESFSVTEIARIEGITESAVKMRLTRGRDMLRELLTKEGIYDV